MSLTDQDYQDLGFLNDLVKAITGKSLEQVPDETKLELSEKCMNIYQTYILSYFKKHFDTKAQLRIRQVTVEQKTELFEKFPELQTQFDEAYTSFVEYLAA
jgi:hypothetical protein